MAIKTHIDLLGMTVRCHADEARTRPGREAVGQEGVVATAHSMAEFELPDEIVRARLEEALDALSAILGGMTIKEKGRPDVVYAKVVDDRSAMSGEQLRTLHFARGVLVENGR